MAVLGFFDAHNGGFNAVFSGFVALFTLLLFFVGRDQHDRLKETIRQSKVSSELQLRAYIGVVGGVVRYLDGSRPAEVEIKFRNGGQTPAHKANIKGGCFLYPHPGSPTFADVSHHISCPQTMPPGGEMLKRQTADIPPDRLIRLLAGEEALYVYGFMAYEDVFGEARTTNYRLQVGGRQSISTTKRNGKVVALLAPCEEGNDSD